FTDKALKDLSKDKRWKFLSTGCRIPLHVEKAETVSRFHLATVHNNLHLLRINLTPGEICQFRRTSNIDVDYLQNCSEFDNIPTDIFTRSWEYRRLMDERPE
ncbi:hypothetical protein NPIL_481861, partial [Nephila pilipes]